MKIYSREELEQLATEKPQQLALIFARTVAGFGQAKLLLKNKAYNVYDVETFEDGLERWHSVPDYPHDWTAVINAGKKAGIKWDRNVIDESDDGIEECHYRAWKWKNNWLSNRYPVKCYQKPNWPDCAALMIVMIEVVQAQEAST